MLINEEEFGRLVDAAQKEAEQIQEGLQNFVRKGTTSAAAAYLALAVGAEVLRGLLIASAPTEQMGRETLEPMEDWVKKHIRKRAEEAAAMVRDNGGKVPREMLPIVSCLPLGSCLNRAPANARREKCEKCGEILLVSPHAAAEIAKYPAVRYLCITCLPEQDALRVSEGVAHRPTAVVESN